MTISNQAVSSFFVWNNILNSFAPGDIEYAELTDG